VSSFALALALVLFCVGPVPFRFGGTGMLVTLLRDGTGSSREPSGQRPPYYELQMRVSTGLHRFVSVCTSSFCNRIIVKDFTVLY
jgi:hypothetical protein